MKKSRFTETQIIKALKEVEAGRQVKEVCRGGECALGRRHISPYEVMSLGSQEAIKQAVAAGAGNSLV